jgi:hypothetical protein
VVAYLLVRPLVQSPPKQNLKGQGTEDLNNFPKAMQLVSERASV